MDKGLLDFGILIQPADISKYDYINIPAKDTWGVVMRKDSPLARKETIRKEDLLDVVSTFNLVYNAAIMVDAGIGYAVTIDKIVNTAENSRLCFRPLEPRLDSGLNIIWKKYQIFSSAAELFLERLRESFGNK